MADLTISDGTGVSPGSVAPASGTILRYTYQDLMYYLMSNNRAGFGSGDKIDFKTACTSALENLTQIHSWSYYRPSHRIQLSASYSTGTVTYADSSQQLTLASGTWPSWAAYGRVVIDDVVYEVSTRTSDTVIVLDDVIKPSDDISTASTYVLYRSKYQLPIDLRAIEEVLIEDGSWSTYQVDMRDIFSRERWASNSGQPWAWAIAPDPDRDGMYAIWIEPYPDTAEPLGFLYRREPRALRWSGTEPLSQFTGVTASQSATDITISSDLKQSMVGSILRFGDDSLSTKYPGPLTSDNPYVEEHKITAIAGSVATIETGLTQAYTSTRVVVTDPCDITPTMKLALQDLATYYLYKMHGKAAEYPVASVRLARENDSKVHSALPSRKYHRWDHWLQVGEVDYS